MVQPFHIEVMDDFLKDLAEVTDHVRQAEDTIEVAKPRYN